VPPATAALTIVRVRVSYPPSQVLEQVLQGVQSLTTQGCGQSAWTQFCSSVVAGQGTPLPAWAVTTLRVRSCVAKPQVAVQGVHADQADMTQSTSQT
jgi:hypothetical protein